MQEITEKDFEFFTDVVEKLENEDPSERDFKQLMDNADKASNVAALLLEISLEDMDLRAANIEEVMSQISILCRLENLAGAAMAMRIIEMVPFEHALGNPIN